MKSNNCEKPENIIEKSRELINFTIESDRSEGLSTNFEKFKNLVTSKEKMKSVIRNSEKIEINKKIRELISELDKY